MQLSILTLAIEMPLATKTYCYCQVHNASVSRGQIAKFEMLLQLPGSRLSDASLNTQTFADDDFALSVEGGAGKDSD